jgi:hypothetical protein
MMNLPGAGPTGKKYIFDRDDENPNRICTGQFGVDLFLVLFGNLPFRLRRPNELNTPSPVHIYRIGNPLDTHSGARTG